MDLKQVIYQIWSIAWIGQKKSAIKRITEYLWTLKTLGVTHLWLSPIFKSPWVDHGYDVADYMNLTGKKAIDVIFGINPETGEKVFDPDIVVLYCGQEFGIENSSPDVLTDSMMAELDMNSKAKFANGESPAQIRLTSRANNRVPIAPEEYTWQINNAFSCFSHTRRRIAEFMSVA